jgi:3-hydroxybutyryl-CoA dehydrogenase
MPETRGKPSSRRNPPRPRAQTVFLSGESALISEFGEACRAGGCRVAFRLNPGQPALATSPGFQKRSSIPGGILFAAELTNTDRAVKRQNLRALDRALPRAVLILTSSVTVSTTEQSGWIRSPRRLIGISALPTLLGRPLIELAPGIRTDRAAVTKTLDIFMRLGKEVSVVQDRVGMVLPRILCSLINEAFFALMEEIASPEHIDAAMKLGTNYPSGPIEWAGTIGIPQLVSVIRALRDDLGEERYRVAPLLQMMAASGSPGSGPST